jgi:hypothetical protein
MGLSEFVIEMQRLFARFGFTQTPLTERELADCYFAGLGTHETYSIGCDVFAGYSFATAKWIIEG